jgi:hypothetical protein
MQIKEQCSARWMHYSTVSMFFWDEVSVILYSKHDQAKQEVSLCFDQT